jgi:hypothetical protein
MKETTQNKTTEIILDLIFGSLILLMFTGRTGAIISVISFTVILCTVFIYTSFLNYKNSKALKNSYKDKASNEIFKATVTNQPANILKATVKDEPANILKATGKKEPTKTLITEDEFRPVKKSHCANTCLTGCIKRA